MHEVVLKRFLLGEASSADLVADLVGLRAPGEPPGMRLSAHYHIVGLDEPFTLKPEHVLRLVDALLEGTLTGAQVGDIIFCIEARTESWEWSDEDESGERVANALFWLGTPEINYPLTPQNLAKIRSFLHTGVNSFTKADTREPREA